jgi:hypothetical protein
VYWPRKRKWDVKSLGKYMQGIINATVNTARKRKDFVHKFRTDVTIWVLSCEISNPFIADKTHMGYPQG